MSHYDCPCMEKCPLHWAMSRIGGKWKVQILCSVANAGSIRYNTLRGKLDGISNTVLAAALLAGMLGFLVFNHHPAQMFMGDTGSLFLGGAVAALAFAYDMPLILLLVGFVYLCETLSDIIQVTYFKLTHGKRIFKMAPLHHHFEMCGWKETKIVAVFAAVSALFCVLAYLGVMDRFGA